MGVIPSPALRDGYLWGEGSNWHDAPVPEAASHPRLTSAPPTLPLEAYLADGDAAFDRGDRISAHASYREAQRVGGNDPRMLSRLGLTLTLVARDELKGVAFCEEAIRRGGDEPDALWRLALVYLATFRKDRAIRELRRGLEIDPRHPRLLATIDSLGIRRKPVIPFLHRSNPLNKFLGKLRHRMGKEKQGE